MKFFDLQLEAKITYDWEEDYAFCFGRDWTCFTGIDKTLRGEKTFNAYNTGQVGAKNHCRVRNRDMDILAEDNSYLIRNRLNYLPDEKIDPSIINLLKKEVDLLSKK